MIKIVKWFGRVAVILVSVVLTIMLVRGLDAPVLAGFPPKVK